MNSQEYSEYYSEILLDRVDVMSPEGSTYYLGTLVVGASGSFFCCGML